LLQIGGTDEYRYKGSRSGEVRRSGKAREYRGWTARGLLLEDQLLRGRGIGRPVTRLRPTSTTRHRRASCPKKRSRPRLVAVIQRPSRS
jgi:hypothetical protein